MMLHDAVLESPPGAQTLEVLEQVAATNAPSMQARLAQVRELLATDLDTLEQVVAELLDGDTTTAGASGRHLLRLGGKRLRAIATLLAARVAGDADPEAALKLAIAVELVHASTLLHDDVIDDSDLRRGKPCANRVYGNSVSILAGDRVLVAALRTVEQAGVPQALGELLAALETIVDAEAFQLDQRGRFEPSRDAYLHVAHGKTAMLFAWALESGALAGGATAEWAAQFAYVGTELGLAFQIVDDVIDMQADPETSGKDALNDMREGKFTWPLILAAEREPDVVQLVRQVCEDPQAADAAAVVQLVQDSGALQEAREDAAAASARAIDVLQAMPESPARDHLVDLVQAAVSRIF